MAPKTTVSAADKLRAAQKEALLARMRKGQALSSGVRSYFKDNLEGVSFWGAKEGDHIVDIIPYFAGPDDPIVEEGGLTYLLEIFTHRDVGGVENQTMICMEKTYKKPCPVCEHRKVLLKEGADEDLVKALQPSRYPRSIYNVIVYDTEKDEARGVQIFDTSHYLFEMYLVKLATQTPRGGGRPVSYISFSDATEGKSIRFTRTGKAMNTKFIAHAFEDRNYVISPELLAQAKQLDQLIHIPTYDEVYAAYWGETPPEEALPRTTVSSPRRAARTAAPAATPKEPAEPDEPAEPGEAAEPTEPDMAEVLEGMDRAALKEFITEQGLDIVVYKEKPDGKYSDEWIRTEILGAIGTQEPTEPGEPDEPDEPKAPPARAAAAKPKAGAQECPGGGIFGENLNELQECEVCTVWDACLAENERLIAAKQAGAKRPPAAAPKAGAAQRRVPTARK